jgi:hypothetical protein
MPKVLLVKVGVLHGGVMMLFAVSKIKIRDLCLELLARKLRYDRKAGISRDKRTLCAKSWMKTCDKGETTVVSVPEHTCGSLFERLFETRIVPIMYDSL